jgi:hypothetical protein
MIAQAVDCGIQEDAMDIQISCAGFKGEPVTLLAKRDTTTGVLFIVKKVAYRENRVKPGFAVVSDVDLDEADFRFTDKHLRGAITAYYSRMAQGHIDIDSKLSRYNPNNKIEPDGVDESGRKYRISPDIDNGQIGVLAVVAFIEAQKPINAAVSMADEITDIYRAFTI